MMRGNINTNPPGRLYDNRHSGLDQESGGITKWPEYWIPAFAGMTNRTINPVVGQTPRTLLVLRVYFLLIVALLLQSCGPTTDPLLKLKAKLDGEPEYSIILEDMKREGTFFKSYYQKYKVIKGEDSLTIDWQDVSEKVYRNRQPFLGLALLTKTKDGQYLETPAPPGYHLVGNPQYGGWRRDSSGNSFWEFYGKYRLFTDLLGFGSSIFRRDYNEYNQYRQRQRPYYGRKAEYGTAGSYTQRTNPTFYERRKARIGMSKGRFAQRIGTRVGRSQGTFRGRAGGFGK